MAHDLLDAAQGLSDDALVSATKGLAARGREVTADLVAHLAEVDKRGLALAAGHSSLFDYCVEALQMSEGEAGNRVVAARAARRFPLVLDLLHSGEINLTTVRELAKHLTDENHRHVLEQARGKRKAAVQCLAASLAPRPDAPTVVRRVPAAPAPPTSAGSGTAASPPPLTPAAPPPAAPTPVRAAVAPLAPERFRYQTTIGPELLEMMQLARDLLSHASPVRDEEQILRRAFEALLRELARQKFAATEKPRPGRETSPHSRHVPAAVKRAVFVRDLGRCAYTRDGRRCTQRAFLEFHHVKPFEAGGPATVENIQLRCGPHNRYEAAVFFAFDRSVAPMGFAAGDTNHSRVDGRASLGA